MAQLVARLVRNEKVRGSIPLRSTLKSSAPRGFSSFRGIAADVRTLRVRFEHPPPLRSTLKSSAPRSFSSFRGIAADVRTLRVRFEQPPPLRSTLESFASRSFLSFRGIARDWETLARSPADRRTTEVRIVVGSPLFGVPCRSASAHCRATGDDRAFAATMRNAARAVSVSILTGTARAAHRRSVGHPQTYRLSRSSLRSVVHHQPVNERSHCFA